MALSAHNEPNHESHPSSAPVLILSFTDLPPSATMDSTRIRLKHRPLHLLNHLHNDPASPDLAAALPKISRGNLLSPLSASQILALIYLRSSCQDRRLNRRYLRVTKEASVRTHQRMAARETSLDHGYHCGLSFPSYKATSYRSTQVSLPMKLINSPTTLLCPNPIFFFTV